MSISSPFIRRPIGTSLIAAALLVFGLAAYFNLPVAALPQVDFPTIQVSASLPGASPETMASSVAMPLERQFSDIPGVSEMTSVSSLGATQVTLQFDLNRNIDAAGQDVQAAINAASAQLPTNLPAAPTLRKVNPADQAILLISLTSDALPISVVSDYADNIMGQQISRIDGCGSRDCRRRAQAGDAHPPRSAQGRRARPSARQYPHHHRQQHRQRPQGPDQRHAEELDALRQ